MQVFNSGGLDATANPALDITIQEKNEQLDMY